MNALVTSNPPDSPRPLKIWLLWILSTPLGAVAATVAVYLVVYAVIKPLWPSFNEDRMFSYVFIPLLALGISLTQTVVMRQLGLGWGWLAACLVGWAACVGVMASMPAWLSPEMLLNAMPVFSLTVGLILGLAQWIYLSRHFERAIWWPLGSLAGWVLMGLLVGPTFDNILDVPLFGLVPGAVSGAVLAWVLRKKNV